MEEKREDTSVQYFLERALRLSQEQVKNVIGKEDSKDKFSIGHGDTQSVEDA